MATTPVPVRTGVDGTHITLIRGDTITITVSLRDYDTGEHIALVPGDKVYLTVKETADSISKVLQKLVTTFREGDADISILHEDTGQLRAKDYVYDVQINQQNGTSITTVIPPSTFTIAKEVTYE